MSLPVPVSMNPKPLSVRRLIVPSAILCLFLAVCLAARTATAADEEFPARAGLYRKSTAGVHQCAQCAQYARGGAPRGRGRRGRACAASPLPPQNPARGQPAPKFSCRPREKPHPRGGNNPPGIDPKWRPHGRSNISDHPTVKLAPPFTASFRLKTSDHWKRGTSPAENRPVIAGSEGTPLYESSDPALSSPRTAAPNRRYKLGITNIFSAVDPASPLKITMAIGA